MLESYTNAYGWKKTREDIVEQNSDIGWWQSPTNLAFVIIGWLYGEGDFKKSLKIAINCGDNTLCTAATLGSILGITGGYGCIPSDWKSYVGNDIRTVAIDRTALTNIPETCTELAERVSKAAWQVLADHGGLNEDNTAFAGCLFKEMLFASADIKAWLNNLSCETVYDFCHTSVGVTYIGGITIKAGEIREIKVRVKNLSPCRQLYDIEYFMPDGFQVIEPVNHVSVYTETSLTTDQNIFSVKVRAGEIIKTKNRGIIQIIASGRPTVILIPILFIG